MRLKLVHFSAPVANPDDINGMYREKFRAGGPAGNGFAVVAKLTRDPTTGITTIVGLKGESVSTDFRCWWTDDVQGPAAKAEPAKAPEPAAAPQHHAHSQTKHGKG